MIKKTLSLILAVVLLASMLSGCGNKQGKTDESTDTTTKTADTTVEITNTEDNTENTTEAITEATSGVDLSGLKDYFLTISTFDEGVLYLAFASHDRKDFVLVKATMTEEQANEFYELDYDEESDPRLDFVSKFELSTHSMNANIPQIDFSSYKGKPISELEAIGFEQSGAADGDDGYIYFEFYYDVYAYKVTTVQKFEALFDIDVPISELLVEDVSFYNFAFLDTELYK